MYFITLYFTVASLVHLRFLYTTMYYSFYFVQFCISVLSVHFQFSAHTLPVIKLLTCVCHPLNRCSDVTFKCKVRRLFRTENKSDGLRSKECLIKSMLPVEWNKLFPRADGLPVTSLRPRHWWNMTSTPHETPGIKSRSDSLTFTWKNVSHTTQLK